MELTRKNELEYVDAFGIAAECLTAFWKNSDGHLNSRQRMRAEGYPAAITVAAGLFRTIGSRGYLLQEEISSLLSIFGLEDLYNVVLHDIEEKNREPMIVTRHTESVSQQLVQA